MRTKLKMVMVGLSLTAALTAAALATLKAVERELRRSAGTK